MIKRIAILFFFFLAFQTSHRIEIKGYKVIQEMIKSDGTYLGTMLGKPAKSNLFSEIIIVKQRGDALDTLCKINKTGIWNSNGLTNDVDSTFDGYHVDFLKHDSFGLLLVKLHYDVPASDELIIIWNDSLRVFEPAD